MNRMCGGMEEGIYGGMYCVDGMHYGMEDGMCRSMEDGMTWIV